jgi:hypothetical protein
VDILFGDQKVSVAEVKKALAAKQQFVQLADGTLGILPEEWLKKYALLFRVGEGRTDKLKLSRYHMSVIDDLYENRNEEELTIQLEEKYERIRAHQQIKGNSAAAEPAAYTTALPGGRFSMAQLPAGSKLGRHSGR